MHTIVAAWHIMAQYTTGGLNQSSRKAKVNGLMNGAA